MIDLHSHILPDVDDGAADLDEAVEMCRMAAAGGCSAIIATPHLRHEQWWNGDRHRLEELWRRVRAAARGHLEVFLGGEIAVNSQSVRELERLPRGGLLPLAGSRYLLLEFHPRGMGPDPEDLIHELVVEGWQPVIAHPERIPWLAGNLDYLAALIDRGARAQLTAMSVAGDLGRFAYETSVQMLEADLVHFVASDAHDTRLRPPGMRKAYHRVAEKWGEPKARDLFVTNPQRVIGRGPELRTPEPTVARPSRETDFPRGLR